MKVQVIHKIHIHKFRALQVESFFVCVFMYFFIQRLQYYSKFSKYMTVFLKISVVYSMVHTVVCIKTLRNGREFITVCTCYLLRDGPFLTFLHLQLSFFSVFILPSNYSFLSFFQFQNVNCMRV